MVILTKTPIFLVPGMDYPEPVLQTILASQLSTPSPHSTNPSLKTFLFLASDYADSLHRKTVQFIVRTNVYPADSAIVLGDRVGRGGLPAAGSVFPNITWFNSNCTPNVTHRNDLQDLRRAFSARAIGEGGASDMLYRSDGGVWGK